MGKALRGKELGRGISQREEGLYVARYTNKPSNIGITMNLYVHTTEEHKEIDLIADALKVI